MKIKCDVCSSCEASVFCSADEAALCQSCDHKVHHANKLASKHQRFSLVTPHKKDVPLCDICKEKRAFLFCQQDRAILCKDCDFAIHSCNEYTQKHSRFLLTGVKLSSFVQSSTTKTVSETSLTSSCDLVPDFKSQPLNCKSDSVSNHTFYPQSLVERVTSPSSSVVGKSVDVGNDVGISEYLIDMLPGWHVEDFLEPNSVPYAFSKIDNNMLGFNNNDIQTSNFGSFPLQNASIWVPQAPQHPKEVPHFSANHHSGNINFKEPAKTNANKGWTDEGFTVPQMSPQSGSASSKRSRSSWCY